jgi:dTDP-4-dehydrorhamnose reductase
MRRQGIAVVGRTGQVARALTHAAAAHGVALTARGRSELDLLSVDSFARFLHETRPSVVVNAAGYTAVDRAEDEADLAFRANAGGPALLATLCNYFAIPLIHLSTDYVFDGMKRTPYLETDPMAPLGVYGASKAAGETAVRAALPHHIILRTSWLFAPEGTNFARTMLRLAGERDLVRVVDDQRGSPTAAADLAEAILDITERLAEGVSSELWGTYHVTGSGDVTWHGLAAEIFRLAALHGRKVPRLEAITTAEFQASAQRPAYSVLDNTKIERTFGIRLPPWQTSLEACMAQILSPVSVETSR